MDRTRILLHSRIIDGRLDDSGFASRTLEGDLLELGSAVLPSVSSSARYDARVGWRPLPSDGFPSIGALADIPGYFEAVTHSGVTLAPLLGRLLAGEMVTGHVDPAVAAYRPDRSELSGVKDQLGE